MELFLWTLLCRLLLLKFVFKFTHKGFAVYRMLVHLLKHFSIVNYLWSKLMDTSSSLIIGQATRITLLASYKKKLRYFPSLLIKALKFLLWPLVESSMLKLTLGNGLSYRKVISFNYKRQYFFNLKKSFL